MLYDALAYIMQRKNSRLLFRLFIFNRQWHRPGCCWTIFKRRIKMLFTYVSRVMSHARDTRPTRHIWLILCISSRVQLKSLSFCGLSSVQLSEEWKAGHGAPGGMSASCSVTSHTYNSVRPLILQAVQQHFKAL